MIEWILIFFLLSTVFILFFLYIRQTGMIESRAQEIFETWRMREQDDLSRWKVEGARTALGREGSNFI